MQDAHPYAEMAADSGLRFATDCPYNSICCKITVFLLKTVFYDVDYTAYSAFKSSLNSNKQLNILFLFAPLPP